MTDHPAARMLLICLIGVGLGAATSFGQTLLPDELRSLANSSGSWCVVAFILAGIARRPAEGAAAGALTLVALLIGYQATSMLRGFAIGLTPVLVWMSAAVTAGPALGAGRRWRGALDVRRRAWGVGVLPGVLIGEGVTSLASVAETTYAPYWVGSIALGVLLIGMLGRRELPSIRAWAVAIGVAAAVALAFVIAYLVVLPRLF